MDIKRLGTVSMISRVDFWYDFLDDENLINNLIKYCLKKARKFQLANPTNAGVDNVDKKYANHFYYKCEYLGTTFYGYRKHNDKHHYYDFYIYKELPLIIDDDDFTWKQNTKYNSKEAIIIRGNFEYLCVVHADGNGKVLVRYNKCENYHRNKVTIAEFDVENAYNEKFLEAIDKWTKEFKASIAA